MSEGDDRLTAYRSRRSPERTPEPRGERGAPVNEGDRFVIQQHHARRLHWDLRLEHDGVLLSWALPRGIPTHPNRDRLAVRTEDHPLEYLEFEGEIPAGEYGAGRMRIWDRGTYEAAKLEPGKVVVRLAGERVRGRYSLFSAGDDWLIHRMDPPEPGFEPLPERIEPMKATAGKLPADEPEWAFEIKWDGVRALAFCEPGVVRLVSRTLREIDDQYPEVRAIADQLGAREALLDGELVAFDETGSPSFQRLQRRIHVGSVAEVRRRIREAPVTYVIFDLLHLDGRSLLASPYEERHRELEALALDGPAWQVPAFRRGDGAALLAATRERGLEGIVAKRLGSRYDPGRRTRNWLKIKNVRGQEMVIGGWLPGKGGREGELGSLLLGHHEGEGEQRRLRFAGKVGTGFDASDLRLLAKRLAPLRRESSPFAGRQPERGAIFVEPELVCEVAFSEWTAAGTLRHPSYKGLRDDKPAAEVVREAPVLRP